MFLPTTLTVIMPKRLLNADEQAEYDAKEAEFQRLNGLGRHNEAMAVHHAWLTKRNKEAWARKKERKQEKDTQDAVAALLMLSTRG